MAFYNSQLQEKLNRGVGHCMTDSEGITVAIPQLQPPAAARPKDEKKATSVELEWMTQVGTGTNMAAIGRRRSSVTPASAVTVATNLPSLTAAAGGGTSGNGHGHGRSSSAVSMDATSSSSPPQQRTLNNSSSSVGGAGGADRGRSLKDTAMEWQKYCEDHKATLPMHDPFPAGAHLAGREKVP